MKYVLVCRFGCVCLFVFVEQVLMQFTETGVTALVSAGVILFISVSSWMIGFVSWGVIVLVSFGAVVSEDEIVFLLPSVTWLIITISWNFDRSDLE